MASITIRNLDDAIKSRLRIQTAVHCRSMEDEARDILRSALNREPARLGGVELPAITREPMRAPPSFDE